MREAGSKVTSQRGHRSSLAISRSRVINRDPQKGLCELKYWEGRESSDSSDPKVIWGQSPYQSKGQRRTLDQMGEPALARSISVRDSGRARDPVIAVRGLTMSYGSLQAVRGIDLEVHAGEVFAFLGPNGAGKTTTVEILEGFRHRTGGEVSGTGRGPRPGRRRLACPHRGGAAGIGARAGADGRAVS